MNTRAAISVVVPLYNNAKDVERAIRSLQSQSMSEFEVVVVNDGSTDGGDAVVRGMSDARIRVIDQENKGVSAARNRGVAESNGELIAFLDADDEWKPDFLETVVRLQGQFQQCSVFATHYLYKDTGGAERSPILRKMPSGPWEGVLQNYFEAAAHSDPPIWSSAIAVKKSAILSVGGFPEGIGIGEDLLTWARLAAKCSIAYSKKQCAVFRLRAPLTGHPTRTPEIPDKVGQKLAELLPAIEPEKRRSFLRYLSMWHRMRASMFLQLQDRANTFVELRAMAHYSAADPRLPFYFAAAAAPKIMRNFVLQIFTFIRSLLRTMRVR